jgi:hypothetical protein
VSCCCEVGISDFAPELRDNRVFAEFKQVFAGYPSEDADDEQLCEYFDRLRGRLLPRKGIIGSKPARSPLSERSGNEPAGETARIGRE